MSKPEAMLKIRILQNSDAQNYFETKERIFLNNVLSDLENERSEQINLNENQTNLLQKIYEKYKKYF